MDENIEKWDGVYLDTDDRVVALDVDGDPENRQAVLIGEFYDIIFFQVSNRAHSQPTGDNV